MSATEKQDVFPWRSAFEVGIGSIDEQHKKLVELINTLATQTIYGDGPVDAEAIFDELVSYADFHFSDEEVVWKSALAGDGWLTGHQESHQEFVKKISSIRSSYLGNESDAAIDDVLSFLTRWLALHILESDQRLATVVLAVRSGKSREDAKVIAEQKMRLMPLTH